MKLLKKITFSLFFVLENRRHRREKTLSLSLSLVKVMEPVIEPDDFEDVSGTFSASSVS